MVEAMKQTVATMLQGIERYNPENLETLEKYVECQARENAYDLEANLAVLKLYQLDPHSFNINITCTILMKALTNLPHTDIVLCKCLLNEKIMNEEPINHIMYLADVLEQCNFQFFWKKVLSTPALASLCERIVSFHDSIRKYVCHVVGITYEVIEKQLLSNLLGGVDDATLQQWVKKYGWKEKNEKEIFIANQDENIKTKNITEKIDFEHIGGIMANCL